jgi:hypothetical protein
MSYTAGVLLKAGTAYLSPSVKIALINVFLIVGQQESGTRKKAYTLVSNHIIIAKMYLVNELLLLK